MTKVWFIYMGFMAQSLRFLRTALLAVRQIAVIAIGLASISGAANAQSVQSPEDWQFVASGYLFATKIEGESGIGNINSDVDISFKDIVDNLEMGAMGYLGGRNADWSFVADVAYMNLGIEKSASSNVLSGATATLDVDIRQTIAEAFVGRKISSGEIDGKSYRIDFLGGARYVKISGDLDVSVSALGVTAEAEREKSVSWVDPLVGLRGEYWPQDDVRVHAWFDYGGFGVGSDSTWQVFAGGSYFPETNMEILAGYRVLSIDYEDGLGKSRFKLDVDYSGPMIGFAYHF